MLHEAKWVWWCIIYTRSVMNTIGIIGCGHMGSALARGLVRAGYTDITVCDVNPRALGTIASLDVTTSTDPAAASEADVVFVVVKPDVVKTVVSELDLSPSQTLVFIAAGVSTEFVERYTEAAVVRLMPNLAAEWGLMAAAMTGDGIDNELRELLSNVGIAVEVNERNMHTATAVNGSAPAFAFYVIKALVEAGIEGGFDPDDAEVLAAQTFKGAAEIVLQSDANLDELIDAVCTPGGTTIEGMAVLREHEVEEAMMEAVDATAERAAELSKEVANE